MIAEMNLPSSLAAILMMSMSARNEYLEELQKEYLKATKKEKSRLLNEARRRTSLARKYLIRKLRPAVSYKPKARKQRASAYDGPVIAALVQVWTIYDYPCGLRLQSILQSDVDRLRRFGELSCSDIVTTKLRRIGAATIDRKLDHERTVLRLPRYRSPGTHPLLYQRIPVKLTGEWDRNQVGNGQLDYVCHTGSSAQGEFIHTLSLAEIACGWWDGVAILGRSQRATHAGLEAIRQRLPFRLREIHPDNDTGFINDLLYRYCRTHHIAFSRSRPNHKNDNAWVEQKNWTHIRKVVGYLRYDTKEELQLLNILYHDLSLYKNFCQPVMKLVAKERVGGKIKRKYDQPKTPYQRLLELGQLDVTTKRKLEDLYQTLNPAELKRRIEQRRMQLYKVYQRKMGTKKVEPFKKLTPRLVTSFMIQPEAVRLHG